MASVSITNAVHNKIGPGLLILLGIETGDTNEDATWLAAKISQMRIFNDEEGKMNLSLSDTKGEALIISQFTLMADTKKGNRPSFIRAARPEEATPLYAHFIQNIEFQLLKKVGTGVFGADMQVSLVNDGPVTIQIDSRNKDQAVS